jgi:GMP synthase-like glutamine amidotransferase
MRIDVLEHAANEGPGKIGLWAQARGYSVNHIRMDEGGPLPSLDDSRLIVIMGGGMNIYQHRDYPWLVDEKRFLAKAVTRGKPLLGICLGAQLLADVLGGKVVQNPHKEVGWWPVRFLDRSAPFDGFPAECPMFHWHGDTFEIPARARRIAESDGCASQAFAFGDRIVGLQFHAEVANSELGAFCDAAPQDLDGGPFSQSRTAIVMSPPDMTAADAGLHQLLDHLIAARA